MALDTEKIKQAVSSTAESTAKVGGAKTLQIPSYEPIETTKRVQTGAGPGNVAAYRTVPKSTAEIATEASQRAAGIRASAAQQSFTAQKEATEKQAAKSAEALAMMGESTTEYLTQLDEIKNQANVLIQDSTDAWNKATEKADEYVQASRGRMGQVLGKLDEINTKISEGREFAKAHDMQVAVQSVLGQMSSEGKVITERYGVDSAEYQQFQQSKQRTLATVQSNIHANYQKIRESQNIAYMSATNEAMWKQNMYTSYQEQQHVETLRYMAQANDQFNLQISNFNTTIEQLKMGGMENLANWMVSTPVYSVDVLDLMNYVADSYVAV